MSRILNRFWSTLPDADELFAYDTVKEVRVLDRRLGLLYYFVLSLVLAYVSLYVFLIKKQYQEKEKSDGWVIPRVVGHPYLGALH